MTDVFDDAVVDDDDLDLDLDDLVLDEDFTETLAPEGFYRLRILKVKKDRTKANDKYPVTDKNPEGGQNRVGIYFEIVTQDAQWNGTKFWQNYYLGNPYGKRSWIEFYWYATGVDLQQKSAKVQLSKLQGDGDDKIELYGFVKHRSSTKEGMEDENGDRATLVITDGYEVTRFDKFPDPSEMDEITEFDEPV